MNKYLNISVIFIAIIFLVYGCKKNDTEKTDSPIQLSDFPITIGNNLSQIDSLQQFSQAFMNLSITTAESEGGITVLALNNSAMINPTNIENFKDYIIKGLVAIENISTNQTFTSITGKQIVITIQNGNHFANGTQISNTPVSNTGNYYVYTIAGYFINSAFIYNDPHVSEYYVSYYENGQYITLEGNYISSWHFYNNESFPFPTTSGCSFPHYEYRSDGFLLGRIAFLAEEPFLLQVARHDYSAIPIPAEYYISRNSYNSIQDNNTGNCALYIRGASFKCDVGDNDSYARVNITDVHVDQNLGLEKRGYYKGTFDGILYYQPTAAAIPEKRVITNGKFMVPMGGNEMTHLSGSAPVIDYFTILTTGKWYFRPTVEADLSSATPDCSTCNLDDYMVFRTDGTCDWVDGGVQCPLHDGCIDYEANMPWAFNTNQSSIIFNNVSDFPITEFSETTLRFNGLVLTHGN